MSRYIKNENLSYSIHSLPIEQFVDFSWIFCRVKDPYQLLFFLYNLLNLTNKFHVAVPLFSNRSQLTFIMWYEQNSGKQGKADCVTNVLATFWRLLVNCSCTNPRQYGIYLFYMIESKLLRMVRSSMCLSSCMSNSAYHTVWKPLSIDNESDLAMERERHLITARAAKILVRNWVEELWRNQATQRWSCLRWVPVEPWKNEMNSN